MTPEKKKLLLFGGGAAALTLLVYFIFFNKRIDKKVPIKKDEDIDESDDLEDLEDIKEEEEEESVDKVTTRSGTRLRQAPNTNSTIIRTYQSGIKLTVIGSEEMLDGTWYEISSPRGWVRSDVVDVID